jgi:hypothetical protein
MILEQMTIFYADSNGMSSHETLNAMPLMPQHACGVAVTMIQNN